MLGFFPLHFGNAVGHHSRGGLHIQRTVFNDSGANRDGHVHVACVAEVAACAAVNAALDGFELVDQLHGMHFGRAAEGARRESGLEYVHIAHAVFQRTLHVADDVHDVAVTLDHKGFCHLDATSLCDAANVVACQIDQHDMLSALLGVIHQFLLNDLVLFGCGTTRAGAGQRPDGDGFSPAGFALVPHQNFGRGPHHLEVTKMVVVHIRTGIERTQRPVQIERVRRKAFLQALSHLHLHKVTRCNQRLGPLHGLQIIFLGKTALHRLASEHAGSGRHGGLAQSLFECAQPLLAAAVCLGLSRIDVHQQVEFAGKVVDHRHFFALQQQDVGRCELVRRAGIFQLLLDIAHRVVAEIPRQSAAKARQSGRERHLEALLVLGNEVERIAQRTLDHTAIGHHIRAGFRAKAASAQQRARWQANEAVAAKAFTAYHRLKQKAVGPAILGVGQLEIKRQRGFKIGERLEHQRDAVVSLRHEAVEFKFGHHRKTFHLQGLLPSNQDVAVSHACTALATIRKNNACQRQLRETR